MDKVIGRHKGVLSSDIFSSQKVENKAHAAMVASETALKYLYKTVTAIYWIVHYAENKNCLAYETGREKDEHNR